MYEIAFKLRELSQLQHVSPPFLTNAVSYFDLYIRLLKEVNESNGQLSELNKYLTFYESLEDTKKIHSQDVQILPPHEGTDVMTLEVDFSGASG